MLVTQWSKRQTPSSHRRVARGKTGLFHPDAIELGSFLTESEFIVRSRISELPVTFRHDFSDRRIQIRLAERYVLRFFPKEMENFVVVDASCDPTSVLVTLKHPPFIYRQKRADCALESCMRVDMVKINRLHIKREDFGCSLTYRIILNSDCGLSNFLDFLHALSFNIFDASIPIVEGRPIQNACPFASHGWKTALAWKVLESSRGFVRERFTLKLLEELVGYPEEMAESCLYSMAKMMNKNLFLDPSEAIKVVRKTFYSIQGLTDEKHCFVPRINITPTRMIFHKPDIIQSNRLFRQWGENVLLVRVAIRDEDCKQLSPCTGQLKIILDKIMDQLKGEIQLGEKRLKFLGCPGNQIRDQGCIFVETSEEKDRVMEIRQSAGNLTPIKNVLTYISRFSQLTSTSVQTVTLDVSECHLIDDIDASDGETESSSSNSKARDYCFTDGQGSISPDLAKQMAMLSDCETVPSAYQIRFGGCKGMVVIDPGLVKEYPGKNFIRRRSMQKFLSNDTTMHVVGYSHPKQLYLNQQVIVLLGNLGVPDASFIGLLNKELKALSTMFVDDDMARRRLSSIDCNIDWRCMEKSNFQVTTDPYWRSLLFAIYRSDMKLLKEKSRIPIDVNKARLLKGVVDDTGTLEENEVFIQYSKYIQNPGVELTVVKGQVVISKSPCLHPGDMRSFLASDYPNLHHLYDVLVFSSKGPRPQPDMLSGSDVDGDEYHAIWMKELLPRKPNEAPMEYTSDQIKTQNHRVTSEDMLDAMREVIEHYNLGKIASDWKVLSDIEGANSEDCKTLAVLHSKVVDAPKTGKWEPIPKGIKQKIQAYPDFMMKLDKPSYPSKNVLGQMYRTCRVFEDICNMQKKEVSDAEQSTVQNLLRLEGIDEFLDDARRLRYQYKEDLQELLERTGIETEAEFMTGCIEHLHEKMGKYIGETSTLYTELRKNLQKKYMNLFLKDEKITESGVANEGKAMIKAAAWYVVCYERKEDDKMHEMCEGALSFAWIPSKYLLELLSACTGQFTASVEKKIGLDVYSHLSHKADWLLKGYQQQIAVRNYVGNVLSQSSQKLRTFLYGMSYAFLFDDEYTPEVELFAWPSGLDALLDKQPRIERQRQQNIMQTIAHCLQRDIPCRAIHCEERHFLRFECSVPQLGPVKGHLALDPVCWVQSALLLEYIYNDPWLLPLLRVVMKWARETELTATSKDALMDELTVSFMMVNHCLEQGAIQHPIDVPTEIMPRLKSGEFRQYATITTWEGILNRLFSEQSDPEPIAKLLLGFFSSGNDNCLRPLHRSLRSTLGADFHHELCSESTMSLLCEEMQRAYHRLCIHCTVDALYEPVMMEKVLHLPGEHTYRMIGSEDFFNRKFSRETNTELEMHSRCGRAGGMLIKVSGTPTAIKDMECRLNEYIDRGKVLDETSKKYPCPLHLFASEPAVIVEGISNEDEKGIVLEDFLGCGHPEDDNCGLYILRVVPSSEFDPWKLYNMKAESFLQFKFRFEMEMNALKKEDGYSSSSHGSKHLEIILGHVYLVSPLKKMTEASEGNSLYDLGQYMSRRRNLKDWNKWKEALNNRPSSSMYINDLCRLAFLPGIRNHSTSSMLEQILIREYGLRVENNDEKYVLNLLNLRGCTHGIVAEYSPDLKLKSVSYPPIHWMTLDIKRMYQERAELDIRYDLFSGAPFEEKERGLSAALRFQADQLACVVPELAPSTETFQYIVSRDFCHPMPDTTFWRNVIVRLSDVTTFSRPQPNGEFGKKIRSVDIRFIVDLEKVHRHNLMKDMLDEMWYQALCLSDKIRLADQHRWTQALFRPMSSLR